MLPRKGTSEKRATLPWKPMLATGQTRRMKGLDPPWYLMPSKAKRRLLIG